ncbi:MAG: UvrD-helicase domain-containing protein [Hormoscilla sp.]
MQPSKYQQSIIEWLKTGEGSSCVNAAAGSGKSTSIELGVKALESDGVNPRDIKIVVFGKANATQLTSKLGPRWAKSISTLHSAGWGLLRSHLSLKPRGLVNASKYKKIMKDFGWIYHNRLIQDFKGIIDGPRGLVKLVDLVRLTNVKVIEESVMNLCNHFDIDIDPDYTEEISSAISTLLKKGERLAIEKRSFDYTDMIWLPVKWNLGKTSRIFKPYQFVFVDECQDLNATQLELSCILAGDNGRMMFVGDPRQAIMGFAGADSDSYERILRRIGGMELPLSLCYRCPRSHIELVNKIFPHILIEPAPGAHEGMITIINEDQLRKTELSKEDLIIGRKTAPLVSLCIKLISDGVPAIVKGRAIGESLCKVIKEVDKLGFPFDHFLSALEMYRAAKIEQYRQMDNADQLIELFKDKIAAISAICQALPMTKSTEELQNYIHGLFSDNSDGLVTLCTCHRAKGLEADRIFLYRPEDMPMSWRSIKPWQEEQEENLLYVALTRSKSELCIVGNPGWLPGNKKEKSEDQLLGSISDYEELYHEQEKQTAAIC